MGMAEPSQDALYLQEGTKSVPNRCEMSLSDFRFKMVPDDPTSVVSGCRPLEAVMRQRLRTIHSESIITARCDNMLHNVDISVQIWLHHSKHLQSWYEALSSQPKPDPMGINLDTRGFLGSRNSGDPI
ncbi:hypothetical protein ACTXT7_005159 [Hymenolepis weldensis]